MVPSVLSVLVCLTWWTNAGWNSFKHRGTSQDLWNISFTISILFFKIYFVSSLQHIFYYFKYLEHISFTISMIGTAKKERTKLGEMPNILNQMFSSLSPLHRMLNCWWEEFDSSWNEWSASFDFASGCRFSISLIQCHIFFTLSFYVTFVLTLLFWKIIAK